MDNYDIRDDGDILEEIELPLIESVNGIPDDFPNSLSSREPSQLKNNDKIVEFLGEGLHAVESYHVDYYYDDLLAWTVKRYFSDAPQWKTDSILGYSRSTPVYHDIKTDFSEYESCLVNGQMLLQKGDLRIVITLSGGRVQIEAEEHHHEAVNNLISEIRNFLNENNFYKGKKISLGSGEISFFGCKTKVLGLYNPRSEHKR